jgi:hypothetical protein
MFYTKKHFAGINLTNDTVEIVILEKRGRSIRFTSAEKCSKSHLRFSEDVNQVYKKAHAFGALRPGDALCHTKQISGVKWWEKRRAFSELQKSVRALPEGESVVARVKTSSGDFSFYEARKEAVERQISELKTLGFEPNGLSSSSRALLNFALQVCEKKEGILLHLEEERGHLIALRSGKIAYEHTFICNMMESCEEVFQQLRFALCAIEGQGIFKPDETLYITGPASFDVHIVSFLRAALCRKIVHPELQRSLAPANLCHSFSVSLGLALEAALGIEEQLNFRFGPYEDLRLAKRAVLQEAALAACFLVLIGGGHVLGHTYLYERDRSLSIGLVQDTLKAPCTIEAYDSDYRAAPFQAPPNMMLPSSLPRAAGKLFASRYLDCTLQAFLKAQKEIQKEILKSPTSLLYTPMPEAFHLLTSLRGIEKLINFSWKIDEDRSVCIDSTLRVSPKAIDSFKHDLTSKFLLQWIDQNEGELKVQLKLKSRLQ